MRKITVNEQLTIPLLPLPRIGAVADDELSAPLGQNAKKKPRAIRLPIALSQAIAAVLGASVLT
jgi:hypothetical protein